MLTSIDENPALAALREAAEKLATAGSEMDLDFSAVRRVDSNTLRALEELARAAEEKVVKIVVHGVNVDVYKVLKLVKLTRRFNFES